MTVRRTLTGLLAILAALMLALAGSSRASAETWSHVYNGDTSPAAMNSLVLTPDGNDVSSVTKAGGTVTMTAPTSNNALSNLRKVFYPSGLADRADEEVCATWDSQSDDKIQEGIAFRITDSNGDVRAVTVTKNVIYGVWWDANVHTWDSASSQPFTQIAQFDTSKVTVVGNGQEAPFPWRVCGKVIGATLYFKLWTPDTMTEPSWTDTNYTFTTTIPDGYLNAGQAGFYVGHIPAGGVAAYSSLGIWTAS
jgi:hypothetical protein